MGPRYTKAIILLVVGFPVLMVGIIIDNSIGHNSARTSTVTIARLMIAAGAIMASIGVFFCCTVTLNKPHEKPISPRPLLINYKTDQSQISATLPLKSQDSEKVTLKNNVANQVSSGARKIPYSNSVATQDLTYPIRGQLNGKQVINSSSADIQGEFVPPASVLQNNNDHCQSSSATGSISRCSSSSATQNMSQCATSVTQNMCQCPRSSGYQIAGHAPNIALQKIIYQVNATDMTSLVLAAKKVMDPRAFEEISQSYPLLYTPAQGEQVSCSIKGEIAGCSSLSAGCSSLSADEAPQSTGSSSQHNDGKDHQRPEESEQDDTPSAPLYQEPVPEIEPPPYAT